MTLFMYNCSDSLRASIRSLLLPFLTAFFRVLHTRTSVTWDFSRSDNQVAQVPSSKTTRKSPRSPSRNCRRVLALVSDIFNAGHKRVLLSGLIGHLNKFMLNSVSSSAWSGCVGGNFRREWRWTMVNLSLTDLMDYTD